MKRHSKPIHPVLLALYPALFLFSHNVREFSFADILKPLAVFLAGTLCGWCSLRVLMKDWRKSAVVVSMFSFLTFSYGHARALLQGHVPATVLLLAWVSLFLLCSFLTIRSAASFDKLTVILNAVAVVLILFPASHILAYQLRAAAHRTHDDISDPLRAPTEHVETPERPRDIYLIILDAYARGDVLKDMYHHDNSPFLDFLRSKGFYVAEKAISNYCQTGASVGACLNMCYLDRWLRERGSRPLTTFIDRALMISYLHKLGYKFITFDSYCADTQFRSADIRLQTGASIDAFASALESLTPLPDLGRARSTTNAFAAHRDNILYILDSLGELHKLGDAPRFVLAYIECPHPPFLFGPDGPQSIPETRFNNDDGNWLIRPGRLTLEEYLQRYRDQVVFLNKRMEAAVTKILENSSQPPIILIIADHGPRSELTWEDPDKTNMRECMSILSAYYLPDGGHALLYPEISPVNSFRVILNHYFGEELPLLPDKSYFTARFPYTFCEVTERVRRDNRSNDAAR